ncbi:MAG: hypothetical protein JNL67_06585 [Planctomycetaceae bacterium]|nr:hypothetical protein [Planctomycetaceae bacterium]
MPTQRQSSPRIRSSERKCIDDVSWRNDIYWADLKGPSSTRNEASRFLMEVTLRRASLQPQENRSGYSTGNFAE